MAGHVRIGVAENKNQFEFFFEKELIIVHSSCFVITFLYVLVIAMYINKKILNKIDDAIKALDSYFKAETDIANSSSI